MDDAALLEAMSSAIARRVPVWYGAGAAVEQAQAVETRNFSFFLRYAVASPEGGSARVLVKVPRRPEITSLAAAATEPRSPGAIREYEALVAIHDAVAARGGAEFRAVRPLGFLDPWNAFAMEEVEGRTLKELSRSRWLLAGARGEWDRLCAAYRSAGRWLAAFHEDVGGARDEALDKARLRVRAEAELDELDRVAWRGLETRPLRRALLDRIEALPAGSDRSAVLHGDFMSANILLTHDARVAVLDTHRASTGSIYEDVARLATDLATLRLQVLSHGAAYPARRAGRCVAALIEGYFGDRAPDAGLLKVHCCLAVVRKWSFDEARLASWRTLPPLARGFLVGWVRRYLRRRALEFLAR